MVKRHSGTHYCLPRELLEQVRTCAGNLLFQTSCVGDDMFYEPKLKRVQVIGGGGLVRVFQDSDPSQEQAPANGSTRTHRPFIPGLQMLAVAAPGATNCRAAVQLFQARSRVSPPWRHSKTGFSPCFSTLRPTSAPLRE